MHIPQKVYSLLDQVYDWQTADGPEDVERLLTSTHS